MPKPATREAARPQPASLPPEGGKRRDGHLMARAPARSVEKDPQRTFSASEAKGLARGEVISHLSVTLSDH